MEQEADFSGFVARFLEQLAAGGGSIALRAFIATQPGRETEAALPDGRAEFLHQQHLALRCAGKHHDRASVVHALAVFPSSFADHVQELSLIKRLHSI